MSFLATIRRLKEQESASLGDHLTVHRPAHGFLRSLRSKIPSLIAEVKPTSPSARSLIPLTRVPSIVAAYNRHAQAISVLCDERHFGGGFDLLASVRSMTDLPILAKEFIIDRRQIVAARNAGADAVLLIAALNDSAINQALAQAALETGLDILFEVHALTELDCVPAISSEHMAIGVNSRNLQTMEIDLQTIERLAPIVRERFPGYLIIAESGIRSGEDVDRLKSCADGFLIGSALLKNDEGSSDLLRSFSVLPNSSSRARGV